MHDHPNNNGPKLNLKSLYHNTIMNWMRNHRNLNITLGHMNVVIVEPWVAFKISSMKITYEDFKKTRKILLSPPEIWTNPQACFKDNRIYNDLKQDYIESTAKTTISPVEIE